MNAKLRERMIGDLTLHGYAKRSIGSYVRAVSQLQNFCCKELEDITEEDLRAYWLYCKDTLNWGAATLRISYSGIKLFFQHTLIRDWETLRAVKFERAATLPVVLSIDEVRTLLANMPTLQHRAFFSIVYGCGLRLNEAIQLRVGDIDGQRGAVHIHGGKGAKDRWIPVPDTVLTVLREDYRTHRNPVYVFPAIGKNGKGAPTAEKPIAVTTIQGALRRTVQRVGIKKRVTTHTFRHSYATHLIEAGVPVRHVPGKDERLLAESRGARRHSPGCLGHGMERALQGDRQWGACPQTEQP